MRAKFPRSNAVVALSVLLCVATTGCTGEPEEDLEHGIINLEFKRGQSETVSPFDGTARIEVTLLYLECLIKFYDENPDYQQFGVDGALVFGPREDGGEGWLDRLCEDDSAGRVKCTVESFRQELDVAKSLTVAYLVEGDVEDRELPFGPLPKASLAACEAGGQPIVRVGSNGAVRGLDGNGDVVWNTEAFSPPEAATGQGAAITIRAAHPI